MNWGTIKNNGLHCRKLKQDKCVQIVLIISCDVTQREIKIFRRNVGIAVNIRSLKVNLKSKLGFYIPSNSQGHINNRASALSPVRVEPHTRPRWQSGNTLASHLWGRGSIPSTASSGKAGSCLPLVGSLQYRTLTNCVLVSSALPTTRRDMTCTVLKAK